MPGAELARYLFLAGAAPFLVLGTAHALQTPLGPSDRKGLSPRDPLLAESMTRTHLLLTRRTDLWRAWVGFNFSHSLGVVLFGVLVVLIGRSPASFAAQRTVFVPCAVAVSALYTLLAAKYWFRTPLVGCTLALVLFLGAWSAMLLDGA
jgi:hypothetical protein